MKYFLSLLLFSLCSLPGFAEQTLNLVLNWKAEPQFGGFYEPGLASDLKKIGYELKVLEGGSGTPTVQMLANKQVDLAVVSAEEILINNDKNPERKIVALFASFQTNPQIIMCRPENHFKSLSEVLSSEVTLSLQSGLSYAQYLKQKYPKGKAKWVPYLGGISNFLNDKNFCQQGFYTSESVLAKSKGIIPDVFLVSGEGFNPYTTVVAIRAQDAGKLPVDKIITALQGSWGRYLKNPEPTNQLMGKINKSMDQATFRASSEAQTKLIQTEKLGHMTEARWKELIEQMNQLGLTKTPLKASEQFYHLNEVLF